MIYFDRLTEREQIAAVEKGGRVIQFIESPSEDVQIAAVTQNGLAIRYIKDPSIAVQSAAVNQSEYAIKYIKNPSDTAQEKAVRMYPEAISFMPLPVNDSLFALHLVLHPLHPETPREILDRAPEILENYCAGLGDVYTIGLSMAMTGDELSRTMIEWTDSHRDVVAGEEMVP